MDHITSLEKEDKRRVESDVVSSVSTILLYPYLPADLFCPYHSSTAAVPQMLWQNSSSSSFIFDAPKMMPDLEGCFFTPSPPYVTFSSQPPQGVCIQCIKPCVSEEEVLSFDRDAAVLEGLTPVHMENRRNNRSEEIPWSDLKVPQEGIHSIKQRGIDAGRDGLEVTLKLST
ncbi:hypothetical protein DUI87_11161 [Hirundo rustica rustica]|uniref:Uncharacterized protein n=1 Tax=Hirundo rustica rustica TaxID=333673 RepID=A0A3M0KFP0_HIRRU|nr:hypothetical protein DUI87_11161 [Hirundo rustica rustica]